MFQCLVICNPLAMVWRGPRNSGHLPDVSFAQKVLHQDRIATKLYSYYHAVPEELLYNDPKTITMIYDFLFQEDPYRNI